jgi:hypothetical protein
MNGALAKLDTRTFLHSPGKPPADAPAGAWLLAWYPDAREATACVRRPGAPVLRPGNVPTADRDAENADRALRRARGIVRRYARGNRLCYLWVLTYRGDGCHDWREMTGHVRQFLEALAALRVPVLIVPEWHPGGHGLHINVALGRWIDWRVIQKAWAHGSVKAPKTNRGDKRGGKRRLDPGLLAGYVAGYVARGAQNEAGELGKPGDVNGQNRQRGQHRYFCSHGHHPRRLNEVAASFSHALELLKYAFQADPSYVWCSWESNADERESGKPPCAWFDFWRRRPGRMARQRARSA